MRVNSFKGQPNSGLPRSGRNQEKTKEISRSGKSQGILFLGNTSQVLVEIKCIEIENGEKCESNVIIYLI